jgi:hypothetical protein
VQRRFEMYGLPADASDEARRHLAVVLRDTGRYIPEVLDSAVGWNTSSTPIDLVWEHSYASAASYADYMHHPFHICVLDRYLLPDSPERVTEGRSELQLGLVGYAIDEPAFRATEGIRRVVALKMADDAAPGVVEAVCDRLRRRADDVAGVRLSVVERNTMGLEWFPTGWTHVWEQVFDDEATMERVCEDENALWAPPIVRTAVVHYRIEPAPQDVGP